MVTFGYNPIHCMDCNLEVPPERLGFSEELAEALAGWRDVHSSIDLLWLDSGAYEEWAYQQLSDLASETNQRGLAVRAAIDPVRRCYYWCFQDETGDHGALRHDCPSCHQPLLEYPHGIFLQLVCEQCSIVTVGE
jgi:predicted  nucleic acid-binding Zn ribbon protein